MKLLFAILAVFLYAIAYTQTRQLQLIFQNKAGNEDLQLKATYKNAFGESYTVRNFKYYISDISLVDSAGNTFYTFAETYLINEADSVSKTISLQLPRNDIYQLRFLLGVDSIKNTSGVQTGDLDPAKGMFWTWNSGYIMAKLDGTSTASKAPGTYFTYHVGGYKQGEQTAKPVQLKVEDHDAATIIINADANAWFNALHPIKISENPVCHSPGSLAKQIADNYATMFTIATFVK